MATSITGSTLKAKVVKSQLKLRTLTDVNFGTLNTAANDKVIFYDSSTDTWQLKDLLTEVDYSNIAGVEFDGGTF
jgi:hypothetical protein